MTKRTISLFAAVCICFSLIIFKIISLSYSSYADVDKSSGSKTLTVGTTRGNIYDCNMKKIVNSKEKLIAVARPSASAIAAVRESLSANEAEGVVKTLSEGYPTIFSVKKTISSDDINTFSVPVRYAEVCAEHIIGYTDSQGNGVCGIEKAYDSFLSASSGKLSVSFTVDANGRDLGGITPTVNDDNFSSPAGVVLTIDKDIQLAVGEAMESVESGACVVLSAYDGSIAACVSKPGFDTDDIASCLNAENSPLVNKAFKAYSVGSVFKPILAACALESGIRTESAFECVGETAVGDTTYGCFDRIPHGKTDIKRALCVSCNSYFINMTKGMSASMLNSFCSNFGFGCETRLASGLISDSGVLPDETELKNAGEKANFSFGQGKLTATPLQLAGAYLALVNGGEYMYPTLVKGTVDNDGVFTAEEKKPSSFVLSEKTSKKMRELLQSVVTDGNAYLASASLSTVGGKTGTAQSGSFNEDGEEILRTWFVGFFPVSKPRYVVAILDENGKSGGKDCCPVFSKITDSVMKLIIDRANANE